MEALHDCRRCFLREKQVKAGSRKKKIELIEAMNPEWNDLVQLLKDQREKN